MKLLYACIASVASASTLTYGLDGSKYWGNEDWGYEYNIYADVGATYSGPLKDDDPYIVQQITNDVYVGSVN